ncbi:hypothetical protein, conserved [Entamoeba histolytica]
MKELKYCPLCKDKIATVEHILLSCIYHKKSQIEKHDYIGIIIWEGLIRKYTGNKQYKKPPYETVFQYKDITMILNKQIMPKSDGQYHKRPDIYVIDKKNKTGLLFDMTIVADHNINGAYWKKRNMYKELKNRLMKIEKLKDVRIIPVVISINGLINKESNRLIKELKIDIDIEKEVKNLVIKNMMDVMEYCFYHNQTYSVELIEDEGTGLVSPEPGRIEASSINT